MSYPGGKNGAGVYQRIINLMPPHRVYIEPFLGGGAIMRAKRPAEKNIGIDLSRDAINAFRSGLQAASPEPAFGYRIAESDDRCRHASLTLQVGDGLEFLRRYPSSGDELVYCDPPYLKSTRKGRDIYEFEMSDRQHRQLLRWSIANRENCHIMISGYDSSLYREKLKGWNRIQFEAMTRRGLATETLWFNFPKPTVLHDYRYLGENFRERERLKRKIERWRSRIAKMPQLEKQALLSVISADSAGTGDGVLQ